MSNEIYIDNVGKFTKRYRSLHCLPDVMRRSVGWNIKLQVSIRLSRWPSLFSSVLVPTPKPIPTLTVQSFDKAWVQIHSDKFNSRGLSWNVKRYFKCLKVRHFVTTVLLVCGSIVASAAVPVSRYHSEIYIVGTRKLALSSGVVAIDNVESVYGTCR